MAAALFLFLRWCRVHVGNVPAVDPAGRMSSVRNITKRKPNEVTKHITKRYQTNKRTKYKRTKYKLTKYNQTKTLPTCRMAGYLFILRVGALDVLSLSIPPRGWRLVAPKACVVSALKPCTLYTVRLLYDSLQWLVVSVNPHSISTIYAYVKVFAGKHNSKKLFFNLCISGLCWRQCSWGKCHWLPVLQQDCTN